MWEQLDTMELCWAYTYLAAAHLCSYSCFLAQFSPEPVATDMCWLSPQPEDAPGSQCLGFPNAWLKPVTTAAANTDGAAAADSPVPAPAAVAASAAAASSRGGGASWAAAVAAAAVTAALLAA